MNKIIGTTRTHNEDNSLIETDIDLTELIPIVERLNELGVPLTLGMMTSVVENLIKGILPDETDVLHNKFTLVTYPKETSISNDI